MPMRGIAVAKEVEQWMSQLQPAQRSALKRLRAQIRAAAPDAEEVISYGQPAFKLHGHLVAFGAFKNHLSFFPMSANVIAGHAKELKGYVTSKGTIHFTPAKPIPASLVKRIVKERIAQNLKMAGQRKLRKAAGKTRGRKA